MGRLTGKTCLSPFSSTSRITVIVTRLHRNYNSWLRSLTTLLYYFFLLPLYYSQVFSSANWLCIRTIRLSSIFPAFSSKYESAWKNGNVRDYYSPRPDLKLAAAHFSRKYSSTYDFLLVLVCLMYQNQTIPSRVYEIPPCWREIQLVFFTHIHALRAHHVKNLDS